ncbi:hypothetical protein KJ359_007194 [Pestalotiopsis sp. 9143b]|nr:hypothetical protein KJ359_007194 [Pestalotiopsis sp. 9143b]
MVRQLLPRETAAGNGDGTAGVSSSSTLARRPHYVGAAAEWDRQRPLITRLYQDEGRRLGEVMEIMSTEHGFRATANLGVPMQWNLEKKLKEDDVLQIMRICASRGCNSPWPAAIFVRGKRVDEKRIRHYVKRRPEILERLLAGEAPAAESVKAVTFEDTAAAAAVVLPKWTASRSADASYAARFEHVLWSMRAYVEGSFGVRAWAYDDAGCWSAASTPRRDLDLHDAWHLPFVRVLKAIQRRDRDADARALEAPLATYFDNLSPLVKAQPPFVVPTLISMLFHFRKNGREELSLILLRHFYELSVIYHGPEHGLTRVIRYLGYLARVCEDDANWYERVVAELLRAFRRQTGEENAMTACLLTTCMSVTAISGSWSTSSPWSQTQIAQAEQQLRMMTRYAPEEVDENVANGNLDDWDLAILEDERMPPSARRIRNVLRYEWEQDSQDDADWAGPHWKMNAMALAKRHFKFHLSMFTPELFETTIQYFRVVNTWLGLDDPDDGPNDSTQPDQQSAIQVLKVDE